METEDTKPAFDYINNGIANCTRMIDAYEGEIVEQKAFLYEKQHAQANYMNQTLDLSNASSAINELLFRLDGLDK